MSHFIHLPASSSKKESYSSLLPQLKGLLEGETDTIANMANVSAALKTAFLREA
jgi:GAF domain-containing protein